MKKTTQNNLHIAIGSFFLLVGITAIINTSLNRHPSTLLWFCYIGLVLLGIGILKKNETLVASQINILAIPALVWMTDFYYQLFANKPLWGITDYVFNQEFVSFDTFVTSSHLFVLPLGLFALSLLPAHKGNALLLALVQMVLVGVLSQTFGLPEVNTNCVFEPCFATPFLIQSYFVSWILGMSVMISITHLILLRTKLVKELPT